MGEAAELKISQYLTFVLESEVYGFSVSRVREILEPRKITKIPQMPAYMIGVINLRGGVVPVIDLRNKSGMEKIENTINTCIIVLEIDQESTTTFGVLVDKVLEVIDLNENEILPSPKTMTTGNSNFIEGLGKQNEEFIILLNIEGILSHEEIEEVREAGKIINKLSEEVGELQSN